MSASRGGFVAAPHLLGNERCCFAYGLQPYSRAMKPTQIKALRKRLGLTGDAFAERVGLLGKHRELTVYKWENGSKTPSPQSVMLIIMLKGSTTK